jgi:hypothetical protein
VFHIKDSIMTTVIDTQPTDPPHVLTAAIATWKAGGRITMTTFAKLIELGYDVPTLERFYMRGGR